VSELAHGHVLDRRYRVLERIGRGGFGDVWRAVELLPDGAPLRDVALKILSPELGDASWAEEAKLLASFSHPSLVTIYAAGIIEDLGAPFVAMELLIGDTLADLVKRRGKLPWRAVLGFAREVAAALDVIHKQGVVHLDLKPANLFVTRSASGGAGPLKVLDFGIARTAASKLPRERAARLELDGTVPTAMFLLESSDPFAPTQRADSGEVKGATTERVVVGTPGYVAPEVLQLSEPTGLADAYALGVTLAVLTTGKLPHAITEDPPDDADAGRLRAYMLELRDATLAGKLVDLTGEDLPKGFVELILRLCAVDPARRNVTSGNLRAVIDEAWARPFGVPTSPYPGLRPLGSEAEGFVLGREEDLARAQRHLSHDPVLAVAGPLGAGRSSFVHGLLVPELAKGRLDGRLDTRVIEIDVSTDPDGALGAALEAAGASGELEPLDALADAGLSHDLGTIVVLDDFEKILGVPDPRRDKTLAMVGAALKGRLVPGVRLVLVIEQEAVERVAAAAAELARLPVVARYLATPPDSSAREIALGPAELGRMEVEGGDVVTQAVAAELARGGVVLPPIALALHEWASDAKGGKLLGERFVKRGGVGGALCRHADKVVARLSTDDRGVADEILVRLATTEGKLVSVTEADLVRGADEERARRVLDLLRREVLLRPRGGELELAHPALAEWPHLVSFRLGAMDRLALRERLAEAANAWEKSGQRRDYLDRGELLRDMSKLEQELRDLSGVEFEFLAASRRALRTRRAVVFVGAFAVVATAIAIVLGNRAIERRRHEAEAREAQAVHEARVSALVARARQSTDPYARVAFLVEASREGATEPTLALELLGAAHDLPPARFLSLEPIESATMPWNDRWVVGRGAAGALVVFDLKSKSAEPEVIEHLDVGVDPSEASVVFRRPRRFEIAVGDAPVADVTPLRYDTALLVRNAAGRVQLYRLTESGEVALAAIAPDSCKGELHAAARASVVACVGEQGVAVWNFGSGESRSIVEPAGALALSPDGKTVATWTDVELALHRPFDADAKPLRTKLPDRAALAEFSPRDALIAVAMPKRLMVLDTADPSKVVWSDDGPDDPATLRWDKGGLDVLACGLGHRSYGKYLRTGGRDPQDGLPGGGCEDTIDGAPRFVASRFDLGAFGMREFGAHFSRGAFVLPNDELLSTTMVLAGAKDDGLERVLTFGPRGKDGKRERTGPSDGLTRLIRQGDLAAIEASRGDKAVEAHQMPELSVLEVSTGKRLQSASGFLLGGCPDGRVLGYRVDGTSWVVFDLRTTSEVARLGRVPGFVIGVSPGCKKLYVQHQNGDLHAHAIAVGAAQSDVRVASAQGYVFDVEPSAGGEGIGPGLLVALSSGEVARIDEADDTLRLLGRGHPRATALGDGIAPGEALFADGIAVYRVRRSGQVDRLASTPPDAPWEDLAVTRDRKAIVLASASSVAVADVESGAVLGSVPLKGLTKITAWDDEGTMALYSPDLDGVSYGVLIPFGPKVIEAVGALASNLRVDDKGALSQKR
jgi:serine/threonine protein kinase